MAVRLIATQVPQNMYILRVEFSTDNKIRTRAYRIRLNNP